MTQFEEEMLKKEEELHALKIKRIKNQIKYEEEIHNQQLKFNNEKHLLQIKIMNIKYENENKVDK